MGDSVKHAILAPSSAPTWVYCSMSPRAQGQYPDYESQDSKDGTASHWIASSVLDSYGPHSNVIIPGAMVGWTAPNGVVITQEMADCAEIYVNDVLKVVQNTGTLSVLAIEQRVHIPRVHVENWGTFDASVFNAAALTLYVWDYKYGHRYVKPFENWQVINYAIGLIDNLPPDLDRSTITVAIRIVQPRSYKSDGPVREWRIKASDLLRDYAHVLTTAANAAMSQDATFTTGEHCQDCKARHACPGAQEAAMCAIDVAGISGGLVDLPPHALGLELALLKRAEKAIKARITGHEIHLEQLLKNGNVVPGWILGPSQGRQTWNKPATEVLALGDLMQVDLRKDTLCTPKQAISRGVDESIINAYSITKNTMKITQDDGSKARQAFTQEDKRND